MSTLPRNVLVVLAAMLGSSACSGDDEFTANVAGHYTVALTNGANSCPNQNWKEGEEATGVGLSITQEGTTLHASVEGLAAAYFVLVLGTPDFDGSVHGSTLTLTNYGERSAIQGNCSFTLNATINATISGDAISGSITYAPATNDNPDCASVECSAAQEFSGSRPPK